MTFDSKTLNAEERALWDAIAIQERRNRRVASESYSETEGAFRDLLKARRAIFGEPASEGGKVEKFLPCGCVRCTCEDEIQCHGCGAKMCELHRLHREPASEGKVEPQAADWFAPRLFKALEKTHEPAQPGPAAFGKKLVSAETHPDLFPWVKPHAQMRDEAVAEATKAEPVAAEMVTSEANGYTLEWSPLDLPQEVREAAVSLRMAKLAAIRSGRHIDARNHSDAADALESFWRAHATERAKISAALAELDAVEGRE